MKKKVLGYWDYTVILTYLGMLFAYLGIMNAIGQEYRNAILCLMMAGVCDMFDGAVAATKSRNVSEKRFGIQIDSLSDLISFGLLPSIFVYMISGRTKITGIICAMFALCALIRLAYFNVLEEERQQATSEKRKSYLGVPVTTIAVLLPLVYMIYANVVQSNVCFPLLLSVVGIGYLSPIKIKKPGTGGKICILVLGIAEVLAILCFLGK